VKFLRASWRLLRLLGHIAKGLWIVALRFPSLSPDQQHARVQVWSMELLAHAGISLRILGQPPVTGPVMLVANHISWLDIFCIAAVCPTQFLAKQEVADWPLFGWLCRRVGTAFIRRGAGDGAQAAAAELVWRLQRHDGRVLVFPEGTSTDGRGVRRFHARLLQAAERAQCPVQALALRYPVAGGGTHPAVPFIGDDELLAHLWRLLGEQRIEAEVSCLAPLPAGIGRDALARRSHAQIAAVLAGDDPQPRRAIG